MLGKRQIVRQRAQLGGLLHSSCFCLLLYFMFIFTIVLDYGVGRLKHTSTCGVRACELGHSQRLTDTTKRPVVYGKSPFGGHSDLSVFVPAEPGTSPGALAWAKKAAWVDMILAADLGARSRLPVLWCVLRKLSGASVTQPVPVDQNHSNTSS